MPLSVSIGRCLAAGKRPLNEQGPGRVERAIRAVIERRDGYVRPGAALRERRWYIRELISISSEELYQAAFGDPPWSKAQRVSVLRAMRRIMAQSPVGALASKARLDEFPVGAADGPLREGRGAFGLHCGVRRPRLLEPGHGRHLRQQYAPDSFINRRSGSAVGRCIEWWGGRIAPTFRSQSSNDSDLCPEFCRDFSKSWIERRHREMSRAITSTSGVRKPSWKCLACDGRSRRRMCAARSGPRRWRRIRIQGGDSALFRALVRARTAALDDADEG